MKKLEFMSVFGIFSFVVIVVGVILVSNRSVSTPVSVDSNLTDDQKAGLYFTVGKGLRDINPDDYPVLRAGALRVLANDKNCKRIERGGNVRRGEKPYYVTCKELPRGMLK